MKRFLKGLLIGLLCLGLAGTAFSAPKLRMNPHTGKPDFYGIGLNDNNIDSADNVSISSVADLDLLQYKSATSKWTNVTVASILGSLTADRIVYTKAGGLLTTSAKLTYDGSSLTWTPGATDMFLIDGSSTTRTGGNELLNIDGKYDTTSASQEIVAVSNTLSRNAADTATTVGWDTNISGAACTGGFVGYRGVMTTGNMANGIWSYVFGGSTDTTAAATATSNSAVFYAHSPTVSANCNDYGIYITTGYDWAGYFDGPIRATNVTDAGLTSGRVTYAGASGLLTDNAELTYSAANLTVGDGSTSANGRVNIKGTSPGGSGGVDFFVGATDVGQVKASVNDIIVSNFVSNDDADLVFNVKDTTEVLRIKGSGSIDWTNGNVIYVPATGNLATYITNSAIGDTLILASASYTISSAELAVNKALHFKGAGIDKTTLLVTTDIRHANITSDNVTFSDMTITKTSGTTGQAIYVNGTAGTVFNNIRFKNCKFTCTTTNAAVEYILVDDAGVIFDDCIFDITPAASAGGARQAIYIRNKSSAEAPTYSYIRNCRFNVDGNSTNDGAAVFVMDDSATQDAIVYVDNSNITVSNSSSGGGYGVNATGGDAILYINNTTLNGKTADVRNASGVVTLYNTTLVSNTSSGTITYAGTVVSAAGKFGATPVAVAPHASAKVIAQDGTASGSASVQLLTAADGLEYIFFGDVDSATRSYLQCTQATDTFKWIVGTNEVLNFNASYNFGLGQSTWGTSATKTLAIGTGTAPTTSPADAVQLYSADADGVAGYARLHVRGEDGNAVPLGMNLVNDAKAKMINAVYGIVTPANVKLFLVFDRTGAVTALKDYSTIGGTTAHTTALSANASTLYPAISGMAPNLTMDGTAYWTTNDAADLSFGNSTTDSAFSIVFLINPTNFSETRVWLAKDSLVTGSTQREYKIEVGSDTIFANLYDDSAPARIARYCSSAQTAYAGSWNTYMMTYSGSSASSGIKIYRNSTRIDDTDDNAGSYVAMEDKTANVGSFYLDAAGSRDRIAKAKYGVVLIVAEELTAVQAARLDAILRAYAGSDLN